jgi:hypothetical protein
MDEIYRLLGSGHEADLAREADRRRQGDELRRAQRLERPDARERRTSGWRLFTLVARLARPATS